MCIRDSVGTGLLDRLDAMQRVAASAPGGPMLIVAGPGTGKTRTLTHRLAYLCAELDVFPEECLAITFTRRAAAELRERLDALLGPVAQDVTVETFHSLGLTILREQAARAGLTGGFRVAEPVQRVAALVAAGAGTEEAARRLLRAADAGRGTGLDGYAEGYVTALRAQDLVDLDELVSVPVALLRADPDLAGHYQSRWPWLFVDEYQDVDAVQYELLTLLCPPAGSVRESTRPESSDRWDRPPTSSSMVRTTKSASSATEPAGYSPTSGASGSSRAGSSRRPRTSVPGAMACTAAATIGADER